MLLYSRSFRSEAYGLMADRKTKQTDHRYPAEERLDKMTYTKENDTELRRNMRLEYIRKREALSTEEVEERSLRAVERITALPAFLKARTILIYNHINKELSLEGLIRHPLSEGKSFAYPLCENKTELTAMIPGKWKRGPFGILEPERQSSRELKPEELDLIICPGTAFDSDCHRLGMGGGYYDRYLPKCKNAFIIMAAFEVQFADKLPFESHDYPMDIVVTEDRIYENCS